MYNIIALTSENIVTGTNNSKLSYTFPTPITMKDNKVSLVNLSMYYSWYAVTSSNNNNSFSYVWIGLFTRKFYTENFQLKTGILKATLHGKKQDGIWIGNL